MKTVCFTLLSSLALSLGTARADTIAIGLQQPELIGSPGSVLSFSGTLTNTTDADVFLNADNFNLSGLPPGTIDDSPFFANTPSGFLDPLASTGPIELFDITVPNPFASGSYDGTFQILGGPTADDQTIIGSADFTVQVSSVPEPSSLTYLLSALVALLTATRMRRSFGGRYARGPLL